MNKERHLEIIEDRKQEIEMIESLIRKEDSHNEPVRILEAGCGRRWPFKMEGIQHILTGLDMDKAALEIRKNTLGDLHETVEGDLCSVDLGANRYDVIYCSFVLEHVKRADVVMKNFVKWIKPNPDKPEPNRFEEKKLITKARKDESTKGIGHIGRVEFQ